MSAILALMAAALLVDGGSPGAFGWIAMALAALAALYEERWTFDPAAGKIVHRAGLVFLARRSCITLEDDPHKTAAPRRGRQRPIFGARGTLAAA